MLKLTVVAQLDTASVYDLHNLVPVWLTLHITGGQVGLPLAVFMFFFAPRSAGKPRYLTLINFCVTWIIYSIVYCLLLYSGQTNASLQTPTKLCLAQASLIHGAPPMAVIAGFEMVLQLWFEQRGIHKTDLPIFKNIPGRWLDVLILSQPYVAFIGFSGLTMGQGLHDKSMILSLNKVYCTTQDYRFSLIVPIFCGIIMAGIIFIEGMICYKWCKTRNEVNALFAHYQSSYIIAAAKEYQCRRLSYSILLRVGLFTLYCIATLSACIVFVTQIASSFPYMVEASLPVAAFLLFGTQKDILLWFCCKRRRKLSVSSDNEKAIPSARSRSRLMSIDSILAPSTMISSTLVMSDLSREGTRTGDTDDAMSLDEKVQHDEIV
ncbi:hypothetical protein EW145_g1255 [Phellinidium pouzarii]|uniref:Uncharacterized protein n=1 Tax=Phellinidium pouzarii TaxID=167371 RepID=A0A4S4LKR3_9AGAM|nr:hypothetical protein EW145_g1255 [Phellinidium pouzarii]